VLYAIEAANPRKEGIMPLKRVYVIARNAGGRPTLQHKLVDGTASVTECGTDVSSWSRAYSYKRIEEVLCKRAGCRA
jgi:hypothetical protein